MIVKDQATQGTISTGLSPALHGMLEAHHVVSVAFPDKNVIIPFDELPEYNKKRRVGTIIAQRENFCDFFFNWFVPNLNHFVLEEKMDLMSDKELAIIVGINEGINIHACLDSYAKTKFIQMARLLWFNIKDPFGKHAIICNSKKAKMDYVRLYRKLMTPLIEQGYVEKSVSAVFVVNQQRRDYANNIMRGHSLSSIAVAIKEPRHIETTLSSTVPAMRAAKEIIIKKHGRDPYGTLNLVYEHNRPALRSLAGLRNLVTSPAKWNGSAFGYDCVIIEDNQNELIEEDEAVTVDLRNKSKMKFILPDGSSLEGRITRVGSADEWDTQGLESRQITIKLGE